MMKDSFINIKLVTNRSSEENSDWRNIQQVLQAIVIRAYNNLNRLSLKIVP